MDRSEGDTRAASEWLNQYCRLVPLAIEPFAGCFQKPAFAAGVSERAKVTGKNDFWVGPANI